MHTQIAYRTATALTSLTILLTTTVSVSGCGWFSQPQCSDGLQPHEDTCLSQLTIEYLTCTENRGFSTNTEFDTTVGGSFKTVADASLSVASKKAQEENTPVALQIVKDCSELTQRSGVATASTEQATLDQLQQQAEDSIAKWEADQLHRTASITLSNDTAHIGDQITVTGTQFQANETIDIEIDLESLARVTADSNGSFSVTVTIPDDVMVQAPSHEVTATGRTSVRFDRRPINIRG